MEVQEPLVCATSALAVLVDSEGVPSRGDFYSPLKCQSVWQVFYESNFEELPQNFPDSNCLHSPMEAHSHL
jgi:hypothetical protein